jgi:Peptidase M16 inactive domain/Insulinase (Peptidase family M16)
MTINKVINKIGLICAFGLMLAAGMSAQKAVSTTPRQEKLLNGLKVLVWNDPAAEKVTVKLRIHGGSAFDPQDREGVLQLLSDSFFPNIESKEFFVDELGGSLDVICNYDYVQINATARSSDLLRLLESVAAAISNPDLDKEVTATLKTALTAKVKELEKDPAYVADRAVAKRLFGTFPYGRPQMGSVDSIQKIDFADLRFAKDRLLTADNATLAVSGNVDANLAIRAVRRYFGSWLKADKKIPSTFKQPASPESKPLIINTLSPEAPMQLRIATRGVSKNDADYPVFEVLARILENRIKRKPALLGEGKAFVRNEAHILPGQVVLGGSNSKSGIKATVAPNETENQGSFISQLLSADIDNEEFISARTHVADEWNRRELSDFWLDVDTFKIDNAKGMLQGLDTITLSDVQRGAAKIKNQPVAMVWYFDKP